MSSDDYFDDELDDELLSKVDAIEAAHTAPPAAFASHSRPTRPPRRQPQAAPPTQEVIDVDDSYDFDTLDDIELQAIDRICDDALNRKKSTHSVASSSKSMSTLHRTNSAAPVQMTLFGGVAHTVTQPRSNAPTNSRSTIQRHHSHLNNIFVGKPNKTKRWDHTAFAKSGWKKPKSVNGKEKAGSLEGGEEEDWDADEEVEFEQFPAPFVSLGYVTSDLLQTYHVSSQTLDLYDICQPFNLYSNSPIRVPSLHL